MSASQFTVCAKVKRERSGCCRTQGVNAMLGPVCLYALLKMSPMLGSYSGCFVRLIVTCVFIVSRLDAQSHTVAHHSIDPCRCIGKWVSVRCRNVSS